jgi:hypothetical protein
LKNTPELTIRRFKLFTLYSTACSLVSAIIATVLYIRTRDIPDVPTCSASVVFWLLLTIAIVEGISSIIGVASMLAYLYTIVKPDATSIDNYQKQTFSGVLILRMVTSLGVGVLAIVLGSFVWNGSCYYSSPDIWTEGTIFLAFIWVIQITLPVIVLSILYQLFKK